MKIIQNTTIYRKKNFRVIASVLSVAAVFLVYAFLKMPALSLNGESLELSAKKSDAAPGDVIEVQLSWSPAGTNTTQSENSTVIYFKVQGGADLEDLSVFKPEEEDAAQEQAAVQGEQTDDTTDLSDQSEESAANSSEQGVNIDGNSESDSEIRTAAEYSDQQGQKIILHRIAHSDEDGIIEYWFETDGKNDEDLILRLVSTKAQSSAVVWASGSSLEEARNALEQKLLTGEENDTLVLSWTESHEAADDTNQNSDTSSASTLSASQSQETEASPDLSESSVEESSDSQVSAQSASDVIETVDSKALGVTMNLINFSDGPYGQGPNSQNSAYNGTGALEQSSNYFGNASRLGINSGTNQYGDMQYYSYGTTSSNPCLNNFTGGNLAMQGIVQPTLNENGYPVLNTTGGSAGKQNLDYLYDPSVTNNKINYTDVNYLFTKNDSGYYTYDSNQNYAVFNQSTNNFNVYGGTYLNNQNSSISGQTQYPIGIFPFDAYNSTKNNPMPWTTNNKASSNLKHHFALTMEADFIMPEDGQIGGQDMQLNYSGDDDMWVFIDDVLVLDLGGIHEAADGTINFAKGTVTYGQTPMYITQNVYQSYSTFGQKSVTIQQMFDNAGQTFNDSAGSRHTIKVFYQERGGCFSDLKISFNIQPIPSVLPTELSVTKQLEQTDKLTAEELVQYENQSFSCRLMMESAPGQGDYTAVTQNAAYTDTGQSVSFGADGTFMLKPGQTVSFSQLDMLCRYYVEELDVDGTMFSQIGFSPGDGSDTAVSSGVGTFSASSTKEMAATRSSLAILNYPAAQTQITVDKQWFDSGGSQITDIMTPVTFELWRRYESYPQYTVSFQSVSTLMTVSGPQIKVGSGETFTFYCDTGYSFMTPSGITATGGASVVNTGQTVTSQLGVSFAIYKISEIAADTQVTVNYSSLFGPEFSSIRIYEIDASDHTQTQTVNELVQTVTIGPEQNWTWSAALAKFTSEGESIYYYVKEQIPDGYRVSYTYASADTVVNDSITAGTVTMKNTAGKKLPETGGLPYDILSAAGGLIALSAFAVLLVRRYRRQE